MWFKKLRRRFSGLTDADILTANEKYLSNKTPADHPHPDGFVYKVTLEYRLDPCKSPFIRITDDGGITGAKICSASYNNVFVIQFGGENISPPLYANIMFSKGEDDDSSL